MIGKHLKQYRINNGLSQYEMADLLETYQGYYCNLERDKYKPGAKMIRRIAKLLGKSETIILEWLDNKNDVAEEYDHYKVVVLYKDDNRINTLSSYDTFRFFIDAENQVKLWKDKYNVLFWYITGYNNVRGIWQLELVKWGY